MLIFEEEIEGHNCVLFLYILRLKFIGFRLKGSMPWIDKKLQAKRFE